MAETWPCGTIKSRLNAFDWKNWTLECEWKSLTTSAKLRAAQADRVDRDRANGQTFTIVGLSQKSDDRAALTRQNWHGKKAPHGGAFTRAREAT